MAGAAMTLQAAAPVKPPDSQALAEPAYFKTGVLTLQDLIWAQTQIERIYYSHRLWPKENPRPKPPFEQMVSAALIEKKAMEPLRMSDALKQYWNIEITPEMLQTEMDRMERESKDRDTLHELFSALHNNPYLIAETLVRDNLAEKALRNHYAYDASIHASERHRADEIASHVKDGTAWAVLDAHYSRRRILLEDDSVAERRHAATPEKTDELRLSSEDLTALRKRLADRETNSFREDETGFLFERKISENSRGLEMEVRNVK